MCLSPSFIEKWGARKKAGSLAPLLAICAMWGATLDSQWQEPAPTETPPQGSKSAQGFWKVTELVKKFVDKSYFPTWRVQTPGLEGLQNFGGTKRPLEALYSSVVHAESHPTY